MNAAPSELTRDAWSFPVKFDTRRKKLARIASAVAALRSQRKVLRVIVDQGEEAEDKQEGALADHVARYPEDADRTVSDFDWITRAVLTEQRERVAEESELTRT